MVFQEQEVFSMKSKQKVGRKLLMLFIKRGVLFLVKSSTVEEHLLQKILGTLIH
jgi:hypothetical protein